MTSIPLICDVTNQQWRLVKTVSDTDSKTSEPNLPVCNNPGSKVLWGTYCFLADQENSPPFTKTKIQYPLLISPLLDSIVSQMNPIMFLQNPFYYLPL
jgi:hypothetical protein